ncbi:MAG: hypothetical protein ACJAVA_000187 [Flavobacteriaceae bacterium]|jgi:hypothetical protein
MDWYKDIDCNNTFLCHRYFGKYKYLVEIWVEETTNSLRFWAAVSSGKKRKELMVFEDKSTKSLGGIKALLWVKNAILNFPEYYDENYYCEGFKVYICIRWSDNKRRDIYSRLEKEGFYFMPIDNNKTLIKEVNYENK